MRHFESGATRDDDKTKPDYEGFYSPTVVEAFGEYMNKHRVQADGELRDSDNWMKGIPKTAYMKSLWRHFLDMWFLHRGYERIDKQTGEKLIMKEVLCAILFNVQGYLYEVLKENKEKINSKKCPRCLCDLEDRIGCNNCQIIPENMCKYFGTMECITNCDNCQYYKKEK